jgi:hypothetical protein
MVSRSGRRRSRWPRRLQGSGGTRRGPPSASTARRRHPGGTRSHAGRPPARRRRARRSAPALSARALEQVVADDEQVEAVRVAEVLADPADEHLVAAGRRERRRVGELLAVGRAVLDHQPGRALAARRARVAGDGLGEGQPRGDGVADDDRDAHAGRRDPQRREPEDLARLVDELPLLVGVALVGEAAAVGEHVEGDRLAENADGSTGRLGAPVGAQPVGVADELGGLLEQLGDARTAGAAGGLVGGRDHLGQPERVVQRLGRDHQHHRGAVGVGDDALRPVAPRRGSPR